MDEERLKKLHRLLIEKYIEQSDRNSDWASSYAHGLFDAYKIMSGKSIREILEDMYEEIQEYRQRLHDEAIDAEAES